MIQLLEVRLCVAKLAEDLFGAGGGLDKCLVVGERQLLRLSLQIISQKLTNKRNSSQFTSPISFTKQRTILAPVA
jgi:hypothetical protein